MGSQTKNVSVTQTELKQLADEVRICQNCQLHRTRTNAVPGAGSFSARIVFVGEGPGRFEDEQGLPFVGRAGQLLDQLLIGVNIVRSDVFVTNVIKCRPPQNRDPLPIEISSCEGYLKKQLNLIKPYVIATLGRHALNWFRPNGKISQDHGNLFVYDRNFILLPLYHPAAALRNGNVMTILKNDFSQINKALIKALKLRSSDSPTQYVGDLHDQPEADIEREPPASNQGTLL